MEMKFPVPLEEQLPKKIEWNYEEFVTAARNIASKYDGAIYDEQYIADAKADRTELSSYIKSLETARKTVKGLFNAPVKDFEEEIKSVEQIFTDAHGKIDEQIKAYEEREKNAKKIQIERLFNEVFAEYLSVITLDKIFNDRWLNKTYRLDTVREEINSFYTKIKGEIEAIHALKSEDEEQLLAFYFDTLSFSDTVLKNEALKRAKERAKAFTAPKAVEKPREPIVERKDEPETLVTYTLELKGTMEQMRALRQFLDQNNIQYKKRG